MKIHILLFAQLADATGCRAFDLDVADDATVTDALTMLGDQHPSIATLSDRIAVAVNEAYARKDRPLADGDTLALIPPVSGG